MRRVILLTALFVVSVVGFAGSAGAIGSTTGGAGAGKMTFERAYDDDGGEGD
jgi:hypothetical protein